MSGPVLKRSEVPVGHTWDLSRIFPTVDAWSAEMKTLAADLEALRAFEGTLSKGPARLLEWFTASEALHRRLEAMFLYPRLAWQEDLTDTAWAARKDSAAGLYTRGLSMMAFAEPEIAAIGMDTLATWMKDEPKLAVYAHWFDALERSREHLRSAEVEGILGRLQESFESAEEIHSILTDGDLTFDPATDSQGKSVDLVQGNYHPILDGSDRELRRTAWENYMDRHLAFSGTFARCLATGVKHHTFNARVRGYSSCLEASLKPHNVPLSVYHGLIDTYRRHLPVWHRYWAVRRKLLGYDTLHEYDVRAPLVTKSPEVSFEQAVDWISAGMKPLGPDYVEAMRRGCLEERWVDRSPNRGKHAGAHSSGLPGTPPFILMHYTDDLNSLSTLAHELGHSMHSYFTWKTQPYVYTNYSTFVAEVASNFNQALTRAHLLSINPDRDFQIAVIEEAMSNFHRYFFIMPALAQLELALHERTEQGEGLTADLMIDLMAGFFKEAYGKEVVVDHRRCGITWATFPIHMYLNFYVFQYATGVSAAHALAADILAGKPGAVDNYRSFLSAGCSVYPIDALKMAGVDMTSTSPVEKTFGILEGYVKKLESFAE